MLTYYNRTLSKLFADLQLVRAKPLESQGTCLEIQETLIQKITYMERKIQKFKAQVREYTGFLKTKHSTPLTKDEAKLLKSEIEYSQYLIDEYQNLQQIFRSIGDGLAFIYLDTWDIKPMAFKQSAGALSGKKGARLERKVLRKIIKSGKIAILNDLTNCLRHGDITVIEDSLPQIFEVKSSKARNDRTKRQIENIEKVLEYLYTDSAEGLYGSKLKIQRTAGHSKAKYHADELNKVIDEALVKGHSWLKIEDGLYYFADLAPGSSKISEVIAKCVAPPIVCFLNMDKYAHRAYIPLALSIKNSKALLKFYAGELMLLVFIDPSVMVEHLNSKGFALEFDKEGDYALTVRSLSESEDKSGILNISHHMFSRISYEFLSLKWFLNDIVYRFPKLRTLAEDAT